MTKDIKAHLRAKKFQKNSDTPILDTLEGDDVNVAEFHKLINAYGDTLEWGASYFVINKLKSNSFASDVLTPAQGLEEGSACWVDFMRAIDEEIELRKQLAEEVKKKA